jgi:hypothetical protein
MHGQAAAAGRDREVEKNSRVKARTKAPCIADRWEREWKANKLMENIEL